MAAVASSTDYLLSLDADSDFYDSLDVQKHAVAIIGRYRTKNIRGYGFVRHRMASSANDGSKLWKHHAMLFYLREWSSKPFTVFLGLQIERTRSTADGYVSGLVAEVAASVDFLIIVVHTILRLGASSANRCQVEPMCSWSGDLFNDKHRIPVRQATSILNSLKLRHNVQVPLLLSLSLGVLQYDVNRDHSNESPRLRGLNCSNAFLQPFTTVCNTKSTFKSGGQRESMLCHYQDDPVHGRWRTFMTSTDIMNQTHSVQHALDPSVAAGVGWAVYDLELEDTSGDCAAYWGGTKEHPQTFAYFRLKTAAKEILALKETKTSDFNATGSTVEWSQPLPDAEVTIAQSREYDTNVTSKNSEY
ncbi:uncharacterized protein LOC125939808 [Dermacentor silvarum]|uniref:uncharacterized protein LOC125939808 n=1 Tax=Dermacentor silvarum TaxID=543639 RepID=UPI002100D8AE|nr:uncharacterized protein LOC125939808 [Dermacentor silvarum]